MSQTIDTGWDKIGTGHYSGTIEYEDKKIIHEYFVCPHRVVEVDKLFRSSRPVAVFRATIDPDKIGISSDSSEDEIQEKLRDLAFDGPELQLTEEFDVSVEAFNEAAQSQ